MTNIDATVTRRLKTTDSSWKQQEIKGSASSVLSHSLPSLHAALISPAPQNTTVSQSEESDVTWRFPLDDRTLNKMMLVHHGATTLGFTMTLNALTPITHDLMEEALNILYDKIESLRICFRLHQNQIWVVDMPQRRLDFQTVSGGDAESQVAELYKSSFDLLNGPLWKARLMPSAASCHFPDVQAKFPYQYDLILFLHHAANDGRVMMLLTEVLLGILDSLLQGLPVDGREVGELHDGSEARDEERRIKAALENDPTRLEAALQELDSAKHVPLLIEAFGSAKEARPQTRELPLYFLDKEVMRGIVHRCHVLGVSTNACMTAILNAALVEVVREAGLKRSNYLISSVHPVDSRRLMAKSTAHYLGYHAIALTQTTTTPHNVKTHFWHYVKTLDTQLTKKLKGNYMCEERVLTAMMQSRSQNHQLQYGLPMPLCHDYLFSNVFSPFASPGGIGKVVQTTSFSIHISLHKESFPIGFGLLSVRGEPTLLMNHSAAAISSGVARRLLDKVVAVLHDVDKTWN